MVKYLLTILCSSKLEFLKLSFDTAINQLNYDDYEIFIVINTLNEIFYNNVIEYFKNLPNNKLKKIIRTESNGKPGKGHNSLIEIFKNEKKYEYLLILDGDDFLYPTAIERINNFIIKEKENNNDVDMLFLAGNTKINKFSKDTILNNNYKSIIDYSFVEIKNISKLSKDYNNVLATPFRLIAMNKKILLYYDKLFHEEMQMYDDYYTFLLIYSLEVKNNFNCKDINFSYFNDPYIYLYNTLNEDSVTYNSSLEYDLNLSDKIKKELNIEKLECEKLIIKTNNFPIDKNIKKNFYEKIIYNTLKNDTIYELKQKNKSLKKILFLDNNDWNYNTINNYPFGGTQSAIYYISKQLSNYYSVMVMTKNSEYNIINENLIYSKYDFNKIKDFAPDVVITQFLLNTDLLNYKKSNKCNFILWIHHDITVGVVKKNFENIHKSNIIDSYWFVSNWQKNRFINKFMIENNKCFVIQNGVCENLLDNNLHDILINKKQEIIFVSSPYRGLIIAYNLFLEIKKYLPNLKFKIFSSFSRDFNENYREKNFKPYNENNIKDLLNNDYDKLYENVYKKIVEEKNIEFYGSVPQKILKEHMKSSMILFYPNIFPETCCTSILEGMSNLNHIVSSEIGALPETCNGYGFLYNPKIDEILDTEINIEDFITNPIQINKLDKKYIINITSKTINLINNYYNENNIKLLRMQFNYIKEYCTWNIRTNDLINKI